MYQEEHARVLEAANSKVNLLRTNPIGYFISSMLAGGYVGLGILLIFSVGAPLQQAQSPVTKLVMGLSFGIALSLVLMAGSELFTGNVFVLGTALLRRSVRGRDATGILVVSYVGNLAGSLLVAWLFRMTGLGNGIVGAFITQASVSKMALPADQIFFRAVLCNLLVCLAVWCGFRCKEETARLLMLFWCLFAFISSGYEHSVANMTLLSVGLFLPTTPDVTLMGFAYNVGMATLGNVAGAFLLLAVPYHVISKEVPHAKA